MYVYICIYIYIYYIYVTQNWHTSYHEIITQEI